MTYIEQTFNFNFTFFSFFVSKLIYLCIFRFALDFESQIFIVVSRHLGDPTETLQVDKCQYCMFIVIDLWKLREDTERKTDK